MKAKLGDLADLIAGTGRDAHTVTLEEFLELICAEARGRAAVAMAAVKLGKSPLLVTREEARAVLDDWVTVGDEALTGKTMRAFESAFITALNERGLYDRTFAELRHTTNRGLDLGETRVMAKAMPTNKRLGGRPGSSENFTKWLAIVVWFMTGSGEANSVERAVTLLTNRDRNGKSIGRGAPRLALPNSSRSHWVVHERLRWAAANLPELIEDARHQGEIARAGGSLDPQFRKDLASIHSILADRDKVERCLRAVKRDLTKTPS